MQNGYRNKRKVSVWRVVTGQPKSGRLDDSIGCFGAIRVDLETVMC